MQEPSRRRELRTYLAHIQRWLWFLALATIIGAVGAYMVAKLQPPTYLATTMLQVDSLATAQDPYSNQLADTQLATTYVTLATQPDVIAQAATQVGGISAQQLASEVHVATLSGTQLLQIQVEDATSSRAAALANALAAALIDKHQVAAQATFTQTQQQIANALTAINGQITQLTAQIGNLQKSTPNDPSLPNLQQQLTNMIAERTSLQNLQNQITGESLVDANNIHVFQSANPPSSPDHPKPLPYGAAGAALGLALAILIILMQRFLDNRVRDGQDVADVTGLPTIGIIRSMRNSHLLKADDTSELAASFRELRTNVNFATITRPIKTLLVTSANPDEGKTIVATNLAISYALDGKRVMLIDADIRHGSLDKLLGMPNTEGLSHLLMSNDPAIQQPSAYQTLPKIPNLFVLTAGQVPSNPNDVLGAGHLQAFLDSLLSKDNQPGLVDMVILVSSSLLDITNVQVLASVADATILVVDASQTHEDQLLRAFVVLQRVKAQVEGVVLNQASHLRGDVIVAYLTARPIEPPAVSIAAGSQSDAQSSAHERNSTAS